MPCLCDLQGDFISADVLALLEARPVANSTSLVHDAAQHTGTLVMSVHSRMAASNAAANAVVAPGFDSGMPSITDAASAAASATRATQGWTVYVRKLLEQGQLLKAVRVAKEHRAVLTTGKGLMLIETDVAPHGSVSSGCFIKEGKPFVLVVSLDRWMLCMITGSESESNIDLQPFGRCLVLPYQAPPSNLINL